MFVEMVRRGHVVAAKERIEEGVGVEVGSIGQEDRVDEGEI